MRGRAPVREHSTHIQFVGRGDWWKLIGAAGFLFSSLVALNDKITAHAVFDAVLQAQEQVGIAREQSRDADVRELRARIDNCRRAHE